MSREDKVLSYHDVVLRRQDMDILLDPYAWLNDQIISFHFEYLSHETLSQLCSGPQPELVLLPPATSFLAASCGPDMAPVVLEALQLPSCRLALFPVNDNTDVTQANGGSHWSLLVYEAASHTLRHYDSGGTANRRAAQRLAHALQACFSRPECPGAPTCVHVTHMPRQQNGYDCGLWVCCMAEAVGGWLKGQCRTDEAGQGEVAASSSRLEDWEPGLSQVLTPTSEMRTQLLEHVREFQSL